MPCQRPSWAQLIAVDTNTGTIVWKAPLGLNEDLPAGRQNVAANPISYRGRNGKQYVAIVANSQLVAFTLP